MSTTPNERKERKGNPWVYSPVTSAAMHTLTQYEMRRMSRGRLGVYLHGTTVCVAVISKGASAFARAIGVLTDPPRQARRRPARVPTTPSTAPATPPVATAVDPDCVVII